LQQQEPRSLITVVIPEFVPTGWFAKLLHGQASLSLKVRLLFKRGVVTTSIPYHIEAYLPKDNTPHVASRVLDSGDNGVHGGLNDSGLSDGLATEPKEALPVTPGDRA
jgi:hypothetical protein